MGRAMLEIRRQQLPPIRSVRSQSMLIDHADGARKTDLAELKRFTFFVSRRFEEGRERFRLHMGYFTALAEAEEWLNVVREIYPGAWAGEAPGKKLRARAAAAAAETAQHALGPQRALRYQLTSRCVAGSAYALPLRIHDFGPRAGASAGARPESARRSCLASR